MKIPSKLILLPILAGLFLAGCASAPFQPVSTAPPGRAAVYIYSLDDVPLGSGIGSGGLNHLTHNSAKLATLGPDQYLLHYPEAGTNSYAFHQDWIARGGLFGHMFLNKENDPPAALIPVEAGKVYYFRAVGGGAHASLLRRDETTATGEIQHCRKVKIEKGEQ